jgi:hypothetical protein
MSKIEIANRVAGDLFVYALLPFHLVDDKDGNLFDSVRDSDLMLGQHLQMAEKFLENIRPHTRQDKVGTSYNSSNYSPIGDSYKYYDFIQRHFFDSRTISTLDVREIDIQSLLPSENYSRLVNLQAQLNSRTHFLGKSAVRFRLNSMHVLLNHTAALGYFLFGMKLELNAKADKESGSDVLYELSKSDFFRNIGWRRRQGAPSKSEEQFRKHALSVEEEADGGRQYLYSLYDILTCYFSNFKGFVRFYEDRLTCLYVSSSCEVGQKDDAAIRKLAFDVLRVPDRNAPNFNRSLTGPKVIQPGHSMLFTGLNEGALVIESLGSQATLKAVANKYLPAFLLAVNQREVLLKTLNCVVTLDTGRLLDMEPSQIQLVEDLKKTLTVIKLKQIFYSVSNYQEIESFFNHLQDVFNIGLMLHENEGSIREMYNLLEARRTRDEERYREEAIVRERALAEKEDRRTKIVETIGGAIACTGLFSYLKDLYPFAREARSGTQMNILYHYVALVLPVVIMIWIVWYVFRTPKDKN